VIVAGINQKKASILDKLNESHEQNKKIASALTVRPPCKKASIN